jgi:hypothetical protein
LTFDLVDRPMSSWSWTGTTPWLRPTVRSHRTVAPPWWMSPVLRVPWVSNSVPCYGDFFCSDCSVFIRSLCQPNWPATIAYMTLQFSYFQICVSSQWLLACGLTAYFGHFYSISYWEHWIVYGIISDWQYNWPWGQVVLSLYIFLELCEIVVSWM